MTKLLALMCVAWRLRAWPANALLLFVGFTLVGGRLEPENATLAASCALAGVVLHLAPDSFSRRKGVSL